MALFPDTESDARPRRRRVRLGWWLLAIAAVGVSAVSLVPAPYVIEQPGPVYDTLGSVAIDGADAPLIVIPKEPTFPTTGSLYLLTVSVVGNPDNPPNWFEIATAWFDQSRAVVPIEQIYPPGVTVEVSNQQGQQEMQSSQQDAIAAALTHLGDDVKSTLYVVGTAPGLPAEGQLLAGDTIVSVNADSFTNVDSLRAAVAANGTTAPATFEIERGGVAMTKSITPIANTTGDGAAIVGITVGTRYVFPFDVSIQLDNVGGPSAGMMFALGIIDKLTPNSLTGGEMIAGTGTITADGTVGPIGGIRQKMFGARRAGATYFLAPESNCDEVTGHIPNGLRVFAVATLDDSVADLTVINGKGDTSALKACPVS